MLSLLLLCLPQLGHSDEGASAAPPAAWSELDAALAEFAPFAAPSSAPFSWGVLVRTFYAQSRKEASAGTQDVSGFVPGDIDLYARFEQDDLSWRVSADFADPAGRTLRLEDAFVAWRLEDELVLLGGQFKPRVVRSGSVPEDELFFRERSFLGATFDVWDNGLGLLGHYDQFDYWLALTNGANGDQADPFWSARVEWALFDAACEDREGAYGAPNHLRALLGLMGFLDAGQSSGEGGGYGVDLALTFGPYAFHAEWAKLEPGFSREIDVFNGHRITLGDGRPLGGTLSRRLGESAEAAVRYQMADDSDSTRAIDLGLGWRPRASSARFLVDLGLVEGDTRDFSLFSIGIQLGSSGLARPFLSGH